MNGRAPWGDRPITQKLYGPRRVSAFDFNWKTSGLWNYYEIDLPAWATMVSVHTINGGTLFAWFPGKFSELNPALSIDTYTKTRAGSQNFGEMVPTLCKTITLLRQGATTTDFTVSALLSAIAANQMPDISADSGIWATYNGALNDPT